jgi:NAD(P)H-flavin reductase/ferredoxin
MSYSITLTTRDEQQIHFDCESEQNLQEAAEAAGFFMAALCKVGSCGSCIARCHEGQYRMESYSPYLLPENPQEHGDILMCRTYPQSDLAVSIPYNASEIRTSQSVPREAEIASVELIADRTTRLVLQLLPDEQNGLSFQFEPGQFVELEVVELGLKRAYSLANTPNWEGKLEFLIRLQPQGQFATYLQQAKPGDKLQVHGPSGTFGMMDQSLNPRCFVAGGAGLAPFLSILRRMAEWGENHPVQLLLGVNNEQELFYQQELNQLMDAIPQLRVEICVWQASDNWQGFHGTPVEALKAYLANAKVLPDVLLCGPPMLVEAATKAAVEAGVSAERIYSERFG